MKAYILKTNTLIEPFRDDVSEARFVHETLAETQDRVLKRFGITPVRIDNPGQIEETPCLFTLDRVYFSERALRMFLRQLKKKSGDFAAVLEHTASTRYNLPISDAVIERDDEGRQIVVYDLYALQNKPPFGGKPEEFRDELRRRCQRLEIPKRERVIEIKNPTPGKGVRYSEFPITSTVINHIHSWVNILRLNHLALGITWMETIRANKGWALGRVLASFPFGKGRRWRILKKFIRMGKDCDIHPTAYLEGCILGDRVKVGAGAAIRFSFVGNDSVISDRAVLLNSVFGEGCFAMEKLFMVNCFAYPGGTIGNTRIQASLFGNNVYTMPWTALLDAKFRGDVTVAHQGGMASVGSPFLGGCLGHDVVVTGKTLIHPGRAVPNGSIILMHPDECIATVRPDLEPGTPMVREKGVLMPLKEVLGRKDS